MTQKIKQQTIVGLKELRENIDSYISEIYKGRSFTVVRKSQPVFKISPVDVWGDEGIWETVVDFRQIDPLGVPASDVLKSLRKLNGQN